MTLRANFMNESLDVFFGVIGGTRLVGQGAEFDESYASALDLVGAEGLAEELAGGAALLGGCSLYLFGEVGGEADGKGAGCAGAGSG